MDLESIKKKFIAYVDNNFDLNNNDIRLKKEHSLIVMNLMAELSFRLNLSKEDMQIAQVIGLLHDIGRFSQIAEFDSYSDKNVDHGELGVKYLFEENHIRDFIDDNKYDQIIKDAILNHNLLKIGKVDKKSLLFCKMIRDMDKVDIYNQVAINFNRKFDANEITEKVLKDFKNEKLINKDDRKTHTDGTILMLSFVFDINFNESFDILVDTDNFDLFLSMVEVDENSEKLWRKLRELCFDKINKGVN